MRAIQTLHTFWSLPVLALGLLLPTSQGAKSEGLQERPRAEKEIVPKGATVEKVAGGCKFTEGPAADADGNLLHLIQREKPLP